MSVPALVVVLIIVTVVAAFVWRPPGLYFSALASVVMGAVMLANLFIPAFTASDAAGLILVLIVPTLGRILMSARRDHNEQVRDLQRSVLGLTLLDIGFMVLNLEFMSGSDGGGSGIPNMERMGGMSVMQNTTQIATLMHALPLLSWAWCISIIAARTAFRRRAICVRHALCSYGMLLAMAFMSI